MTALFVIKFDNGSYNYGVGDMNGHEAGRNEATEYTEEEVRERMEQLMGVVAVEVVNPKDIELANELSLLSINT